MTERDYAVAEDPKHDGKLLLHRADCPLVRKLAAAGWPVLTMFGARQEPGLAWARHDCLKEVKRSG
jgi:hypothetical protein